MRYRLHILAALVIGCAIGRTLTPRPAAELRVSGRWVQVYQHGELVGEYDERDGQVYDVLLAAAVDQPALPDRLRPPYYEWKMGILPPPSEKPQEAP